MLGILSLITWSLIIVVTLKYVIVVMRADNSGEGGVLALMALVQRALRDCRARGASSDLCSAACRRRAVLRRCLLTPAISVLSAVEGLDVATPTFDRWSCRSPSASWSVCCDPARRQGGVGGLFGPVMLLWFVMLVVLGVRRSSKRRRSCRAQSLHARALLHPGVDGVSSPWARSPRR